MTATATRAEAVAAAAATVAVSLVSHTNAGKTTLARTLLGRDIGEVRDAPHVTEFAEVHTMLRTPGGDRLELWDTPGFGDSVRLVRRLKQRANPIGWFMSEVWDRWRDRPFWATQQALKNVRDEADVLLYVVSVAESPEAAGYVAPEMELLAWTGKPVVVLLNQLGALPNANAEDGERWRARIASLAPAARVLPFDAFARCWVQEVVLLDAIEAALPGESAKRTAMIRLRAAWQHERLAAFEQAMAILAESLLRIAAAQEIVAEGGGFRERLRSAGAALGIGRAGSDGPTAAAQARLGERLKAELRESTSALIRLHRLEGESQAALLEAVQVDLHQKVDAGWAAIWGGAASGALAGLSADLGSGGLTLGGGLIVGSILGALGAAGLAHGVNQVRGTDRSWLAWKADALDALAEAQLLRYLAVAHVGRGRGAWSDRAAPEHWPQAVHAALEPHRAGLAAVWSGRGGPDAATAIPDSHRAELTRLLGAAMRAVLQRLYAEAGHAFTPTREGGEIAQPRVATTP